MTLNGITLTDSPAGNYDSTLVCHDFSYLPSGLLPITVQYASDPTDVNNAFQFWIIPVKSVTEVAIPVRLCAHPHARMQSAAQMCLSSCLHVTVYQLPADPISSRGHGVQNRRQEALSSPFLCRSGGRLAEMASGGRPWLL